MIGALLRAILARPFGAESVYSKPAYASIVGAIEDQTMRENVTTQPR